MNGDVANDAMTPATSYTAIFTYWYLTEDGRERADTVTGDDVGEIEAVQVRVIVDDNLQRSPAAADLTTTGTSAQLDSRGSHEKARRFERGGTHPGDRHHRRAGGARRYVGAGPRHAATGDGAGAHTQDVVQLRRGSSDSAVQLIKTKTVPTTDPGAAWLTQAELQSALEAAGFPDNVEVTSFAVYDNLTPVQRAVTWDANADGMIWLEITVVYEGKTSRVRVLIRQVTQSVVKSFPKAAVYSDTSIYLDGTSDVCAGCRGRHDGVEPGEPWRALLTATMAGGGTDGRADTDDFRVNGSANLAAPGASAQSVNIQVNGSVLPSDRFQRTVTGAASAS